MLAAIEAKAQRERAAQQEQWRNRRKKLGLDAPGDDCDRLEAAVHLLTQSDLPTLRADVPVRERDRFARSMGL